MVDGAHMRSRNEPRCTTLTPAQLNELIAIIAEDHGLDLRQHRFNDIVLMLCEDIAGLETLTPIQRNQLLKKLWYSTNVPTTIFNAAEANVLIVLPRWINNGPIPVLDTLHTPRC